MWRRVFLILVVAATGCDDRPAGADAGAGSVDAGVADAGSGTDAGAGADAGSGSDSGTGADAGPGSDAGPSTDAGAGTDAGSGTDAGAGTDAGPGMDAGTDAGFDAGTDAGSDAGVPARSDHHIHIDVDNFCNMTVTPMEITIPAGQTAYFDWHNHSRDYAVDVWMSYGGGFTDLATGATWDEPIGHCATPRAHTEYADIDTACSGHRFLIHCL